MSRSALRYALAALVIAAGLAGPSAGQTVPPLQTPDVTTLLAPSGGSPGDAAASGDDSNAPDEAAPPCGTQTITIARMAWPSAALLAEIHARLLKAQFSSIVQVIPTDLAPALSGMDSTGQPAVAPEMWVARVADQWNQAVKDQKVRQVGLSYAATTLEGWFVPDYVAAAHPELKSAAALKDDWQLFATPGQGKAKFISCPADWACAIINRNLIKAEGLEDNFQVVEPKNRFDLDQTIGAAVNRKEPILFYYWQPNATLAQFAFNPVDLGPYSKDDFACLGKRSCATPKASSYAPEPVVIALAQWVFTDAPQVAAYFQRAQMPIGEMNKLLGELNEPNATVESVADRFVAERQEVWQKWVGTPPAGAAGTAAPKADSGAAPAAAAPDSGASAPAAPGTTSPSGTRRRRTIIIAPDVTSQPAPANDNDLPPPSLTQH